MKKDIRQRLGIIGTVGVPARYGGFETLAHHLVPNLRDHLDITVYCSSKAYSKEEQVKEWEGAKLHYIPLDANGIQSIFYDLKSISHAVRHQDILLILGVSACLFLPFFKLFFPNKKFIVNIDGLEWKRAKWNKFAKLFLLMSETIACRFADEIVTDNQILKEYVKIRYGINGNLIEYGADHVSPENFGKEDLSKYDFLGTNYAFKVARIEPENNLHLILAAFKNMASLPLVIVGNWDNSEYGKRLREEYSTYGHIYLLDPIYEPRHLNVLRSNCKVYLHGHSAGGTNPSLVEAMHLGLPVISFDVIYNRVTTNNQGLFFHTTDELRQIVKNLTNTSLKSIAIRMRKFAEKKYTWKIVSQKYGALAGLKFEDAKKEDSIIEQMNTRRTRQKRTA